MNALNTIQKSLSYRPIFRKVI